MMQLRLSSLRPLSGVFMCQLWKFRNGNASLKKKRTRKHYIVYSLNRGRTNIRQHFIVELRRTCK